MARGLQDNVEKFNMYLESQEKMRKCGAEKIFEEIIAKNSPNLKKNTNLLNYKA